MQVSPRTRREREGGIFPQIREKKQNWWIFQLLRPVSGWVTELL